MGFQFVEGYGSGQFRRLLVLNAEDAFDVTGLQISDQNDLMTILLNSSRVTSAIHGAGLVSGTLSLSSVSVAAPEDFRWQHRCGRLSGSAFRTYDGRCASQQLD
jgi:hypothetical protein